MLQLWTEDVKSNGTTGIQDPLEGKVLMGFSRQELVVLNPFSCISFSGYSG